jgi:hypothetical protein
MATLQPFRQSSELREQVASGEILHIDPDFFADALLQKLTGILIIPSHHLDACINTSYPLNTT